MNLGWIEGLGTWAPAALHVVRWGLGMHLLQEDRSGAEGSPTSSAGRGCTQMALKATNAGIHFPTGSAHGLITASCQKRGGCPVGMDTAGVARPGSSARKGNFASETGFLVTKSNLNRWACGTDQMVKGSTNSLQCRKTGSSRNL